MQFSFSIFNFRRRFFYLSLLLPLWCLFPARGLDVNCLRHSPGCFLQCRHPLSHLSEHPFQLCVPILHFATFPVSPIQLAIVVFLDHSCWSPVLILLLPFSSGFSQFPFHLLFPVISGGSQGSLQVSLGLFRSLLEPRLHLTS